MRIISRLCKTLTSIYPSCRFPNQDVPTPYPNMKYPPLGDDDIPFPPYGGRHIVTMMPGNGIGPELMAHVEDIMRHINAPIDFEKIIIQDGPTLQTDLNKAVMSVKRNGVALKGKLSCERNFYRA